MRCVSRAAPELIIVHGECGAFLVTNITAFTFLRTYKDGIIIYHYSTARYQAKNVVCQIWFFPNLYFELLRGFNESVYQESEKVFRLTRAFNWSLILIVKVTCNVIVEYRYERIELICGDWKSCVSLWKGYVGNNCQSLHYYEISSRYNDRL